MYKITREIENLSSENFDLIIAGGGIYGSMLSLEAARHGIRSVMLEKDDFGSQTSANHLKTVHGGLRYLQSADIVRFIESVKERRWFLKYLGKYVDPLPCIMPLYGKGVYRNSIFRVALLLNDILSSWRNIGVSDPKKLRGGRVLSPDKTKKIFPDIFDSGLRGSAMWFDAGIEEFQRLNMRLLKSAASKNARFVNYFKVDKPVIENGKTVGIIGTDILSGKEVRINAPVIINAAGPWSRELSGFLDRDHPNLFKKKLLLWNILFDRPSLSANALGLSTRTGKKHTYFFHPWKGRLLVGTGEKFVKNESTDASVSSKYLEEFIDDINSLVPGLGLRREEIVKIYSGILPGNENRSLSKRPVVIDHSDFGGPEGLWSVSGVKFTTSRLVAERLIKKVFHSSEKFDYSEMFKSGDSEDLFLGYDETLSENSITKLKNIVENESVLHLSDLVFYRTSIGDNPKRTMEVLKDLRKIFKFNDKQWKDEIDRLKLEFEEKRINI